MHVTYEAVSRLGWGFGDYPNAATENQIQTGAILRVANALEAIESHLEVMARDARAAHKAKEEAEEQRRETQAETAKQWVAQMKWPNGRARNRAYWAAWHVLEAGCELTPEAVIDALPLVRSCGKKTQSEVRSVLLPTGESAVS